MSSEEDLDQEQAKIEAMLNKVMYMDSDGSFKVSEENAKELLRLLKAKMARLETEKAKKQDSVVNDDMPK